MSTVEKILRDGVKDVICSFSPAPVLNADFKFKSSNHYFRELCFCLKGKSHYMLNNQVYTCVPGCIILIDHWEEHAFGYLPDDCNLLHLWIQLHEDNGMRAFFVNIGSKGVYQNEFQPIKLTNGYMQILNARWDAMLEVNPLHSPEIAARYMSGAVNAILDEVMIKFRGNNVPVNVKKDAVIDSLKQYILSCNGRGCSLKNLEKFSGYNRFYLSHRFKKKEGISIGDYINRIRVAYTEAALRHGCRQKEIAAKLGFSSAANFWSWLKKYRNDTGNTLHNDK